MPSKQVHQRAKKNQSRLLPCRYCGETCVVLSPEYTQICVSDDRRLQGFSMEDVISRWNDLQNREG